VKTFETTLNGQDGTPFFIRGWEPENGKPKALIALVHGLGEHTGRYVHVGKVMTDAGYAMAGFDLRGHGQSGGPRGHSPSLEAYMQDICQFVQWMAKRYAGTPQFIYGHSLGGLLSLTYAIQYGAGLKGVLVTGPGLNTALQQQKAKVVMVRLLGSLLPAFTAPSGLDALSISHDPQVVQAYHGTEDKIAYPSGSTEFARRVRAAGGDVTLKLWDGLYHEVHNEPEKSEVFKFMVAWLDKHL
jgi:alpha-beta hydrolase superfamily lysophospholipase